MPFSVRRNNLCTWEMISVESLCVFDQRRLLNLFQDEITRHGDAAKISLGDFKGTCRRTMIETAKANKPEPNTY